MDGHVNDSMLAHDSNAPPYSTKGTTTLEGVVATSNDESEGVFAISVNSNSTNSTSASVSSSPHVAKELIAPTIEGISIDVAMLTLVSLLSLSLLVLALPLWVSLLSLSLLVVIRLWNCWLGILKQSRSKMDEFRSKKNIERTPLLST